MVVLVKNGVSKPWVEGFPNVVFGKGRGVPSSSQLPTLSYIPINLYTTAQRKNGGGEGDGKNGGGAELKVFQMSCDYYSYPSPLTCIDVPVGTKTPCSTFPVNYAETPHIFPNRGKQI